MCSFDLEHETCVYRPSFLQLYVLVSNFLKRNDFGCKVSANQLHAFAACAWIKLTGSPCTGHDAHQLLKKVN